MQLVPRLQPAGTGLHVIKENLKDVYISSHTPMKMDIAIGVSCSSTVNQFAIVTAREMHGEAHGPDRGWSAWAG